MATAINEGVYNEEFLIHESDKRYTRGRNLTLKANAARILPGTVLGQETLGAQSAVGAAVAGNVTTDTIGTVSAATNAAAGVWPIVAIAAVTNLGTFEVFRPNGVFDGTGKVGTQYTSVANGGISFLITDTGTDLVAGDRYAVTVSYAVGSLKLVPLTLDGVNGSQTVHSILTHAVEISATDTRNAPTIVRGRAEVDKGLLVYPVGATSDQKLAINAALEAKGIYPRTAQ